MVDKLNYLWYILLVWGGKEKQIIAKIKEVLEISIYKDKVDNLCFLPCEDGNKQKNMIPGYVFCHALLEPGLVRLIYSVPGVNSFMNHSKTSEDLPNPLPFQFQVNKQISSLLDKKITKSDIENTTDFKVGNWIRVQNHRGEIIGISEKKKQKMLTVRFPEVNFFGQQVIDIPWEECVRDE